MLKKKSAKIQKSFYYLLRLYELITFKKLNEEISKRDYLIFYILRTLAYSYRERRLPNIIEVYRNNKKFFNELEIQRNELYKNTI